MRQETLEPYLNAESSSATAVRTKSTSYRVLSPQLKGREDNAGSYLFIEEMPITLLLNLLNKRTNSPNP